MLVVSALVTPVTLSQHCYVVDASAGDFIFSAPAPGQHVIIFHVAHISIFSAPAPVVQGAILTP